jgi:hypothetical protein
VPKYFEKDISSGVPTLTQSGRDALDEEVKYEDEDVEKDADADAGGREGANDDNDDGSGAPSPRS